MLIIVAIRKGIDSVMGTCAYDAQKCGSDSKKILHKAFVNDLGNGHNFT